MPHRRRMESTALAAKAGIVPPDTANAWADARRARQRAAAKIAYGWVTVRVGVTEILSGLIAWLRASCG